MISLTEIKMISHGNCYKIAHTSKSWTNSGRGYVMFRGTSPILLTVNYLLFFCKYLGFPLIV